MTKEEALRLALDALECWQRNEDCNEPRSKIIGAIKAALEAKDEPVAWAMLHDNGHFIDAIHPDEHAKVEGEYTHPLYTTPPQRTWVGLTDEEIEQGCKESWITEQAFQSAVWWAEAKLKEKNT
jgi:hypothetical protein